MFKLFLVILTFALAYAHPGVIAAPVVPVVQPVLPVHHGVAHHVAPVIQHHGAHAVHSHVIHHPSPVKVVATPVVAKPIVAVHHSHHVVPHAVVKPVVPIVPALPVHHAHPAVIAHH